MITYLTRTQLNKNEYDNCIHNAPQSKVYALSWYLDIVADNWGALVLNNYEAVMPLPWRKKYGICYVYPPCWTQQLGVFSKKEITPNDIQLFMDAIPKKFKKITIQFNAENKLIDNNATKKNNYLIPLCKSYAEIYANYNKLRKRKLKSKKQIHIKSLAPTQFIEFSKKVKTNAQAVENDDYDKLLNLMEHCVANEKGEVRGVFNDADELIGGSFFLKSNNRITYLFSRVNNKGKQLNGMTVLIDDVLERHANSNFVFDFEGSMVEGIALFFKSFGAEAEVYSLFSKSKLYNPIKLLSS